jgi:hypothetical protein
MDWKVRGSNPDGGEIFRTLQTGPGAHPASYTTGTVSFPVIKRLGRGDDYPPHLQPRLRKEYNFTSTPLLGFVACFRVNFTSLYYTSYIIHQYILEMKSVKTDILKLFL